MVRVRSEATSQNEAISCKLYLKYKKASFSELYNNLSLQMKSGVPYFNCQRGELHDGETLNVVCLNSSCFEKGEILCCCTCIEQNHKNHNTKPLKKVIFEAQGMSKIKQGDSAPTREINQDLICQMLQGYEWESTEKLGKLKGQCIQTFNLLEHNIKKYYQTVASNFKKQEAIEKSSSMAKNLQSKINSLQKCESEGNLKAQIKEILQMMGESQKKLPGDENRMLQGPALLHFLENSNKEIEEVINIEIAKIYEKLSDCNRFMENIIPKVDLLWSRQLFRFSDSSKHPYIKKIDDYKILATEDSIYQMSLLEPRLSLEKGLQSFRFKIVHTDLEWVGLGVCSKKVAQKFNYQFNFSLIGHGGYLISGNGGSWCHHDANWNNLITSFKFTTGDIVTVLVQKNKIHFLKNIPIQHSLSDEYSQKQSFDLEIDPSIIDDLYPCVVCFYKSTVVEYLPSFSSIVTDNEKPVYNYHFSQSLRHKDIQLLSKKSVISLTSNIYKTCLLNKSVEEGDISKPKTFRFRITKCSGWSAVGMCHKQTVQSKDYSETFENYGHGYYLLSSNGGSWSNCEPENNGIIKTFKMKSGDVIQVTVSFGGAGGQENYITFKNGIQKYQLKFNRKVNQPLYPCAVLYYNSDEITVLPDY